MSGGKIIEKAGKSIITHTANDYSCYAETINQSAAKKINWKGTDGGVILGNDPKDQDEGKTIVKTAYFARKIEKKVKITTNQEYIVKAGDKHTTIARNVKGVNAKELRLKQPKLKPGESITLKVHGESKELSLEKLSSVSIGTNVFIVVETFGLKDTILTIEVLGSNNITFVKPDEVVPLLVGEDEKTNLNATVGDYLSKQEYSNTSSFINKAIIEVSLKPKDSEKLQEWQKKIEDSIEQKAFLHLRIKAETEKDVIYYNEDEKIILQTKDKGIYLNKKNQWFTIRVCDCGKKHENDIFCTKYKPRNITHYGPLYGGSIRLANYSGWSELIANKKVTQEDKEILIAMSENEGKLDSIQSYDSEIVTVGAMQKTINPEGYGEFPIQMWTFKKEYPKKFKILLEDCLWTVAESIKKNNQGQVTSAVYQAFYNGITGVALKKHIREGFTAANFGKKVKSPPCEPLINLSKDIDFQGVQVKDFIIRLNEIVLEITPDGYSNKLREYVKSKLGKATLLDHHINRPRYVKKDFADALNRFYTQNPKVSANPAQWGVNHEKYERSILDDYGINRRGTDMPDRYAKLNSKL